MAPTRLTCPSCQAALKLAGDIPPGKTIRCPKCSTAFRVPPPADEPDEPDGVEEAPRSAVRRGPAPAVRKSRSEEEDSDERQEIEEKEQEERPRKRKSKKRQKEASSNKKLYLWLGAGGGRCSLASWCC